MISDAAQPFVRLLKLREFIQPFVRLLKLREFMEDTSANPVSTMVASWAGERRASKFAG